MKRNVAWGVSAVALVGVVVLAWPAPAPKVDDALQFLTFCDPSGLASVKTCADRTPPSALEWFTAYRVTSGTVEESTCGAFSSQARAEPREDLRCAAGVEDCPGMCVLTKPADWSHARCPKLLAKDGVQCFSCFFRQGEERHQYLLVTGAHCADALLYQGINVTMGEAVCDARLKFSACVP